MAVFLLRGSKRGWAADKLRAAEVVPFASAGQIAGKVPMETLFERFICNFIRRGSLEIDMPSGRRISAGDGAGPPLAIALRDGTALSRLLRNPELAFGELHMEGALIVTRGSLFDVIVLALHNLGQKGEARWMVFLRKLRTRLRRLDQRNNLLRARQNVSHHYDLDARLYSLFLDEDRQYSCAYFEHPEWDLETAQRAKQRHIAAKLLVGEGARVLDIGCGFGGMALYLARVCGAQATGITLSQEQFAMASARASTSGLDRPPEFRLQDYRETGDRFARVVSVGMFEHVGLAHYQEFFSKLYAMLEDDGIALLHTIGRTDPPCATNPFITKYIFPGGYVPALSEIMPAIEGSGLIVTDIEILRLHYAHTLRHWRLRFMAHHDEIAALYDERLCRMWEFYLAASEATFCLGQNVVFQIQLARCVDAVPMTRDYIAREEQRLREAEEVVFTSPCP